MRHFVYNDNSNEFFLCESSEQALEAADEIIDNFTKTEAVTSSVYVGSITHKLVSVKPKMEKVGVI